MCTSSNHITYPLYSNSITSHQLHSIFSHLFVWQIKLPMVFARQLANFCTVLSPQTIASNSLVNFINYIFWFDLNFFRSTQTHSPNQFHFNRKRPYTIPSTTNYYFEFLNHKFNLFTSQHLFTLSSAYFFNFSHFLMPNFCLRDPSIIVLPLIDNFLCDF